MGRSDALEVLFVCTGNVNRSALAEVLLQRWADWYLPSRLAGAVRVASGGLAAPVGRSMSRRAQAAAAAFGGDGASHRVTQLTEEAVRDADLVLVASREQIDGVLGFAPAALNRTFTIREAARIVAGWGPASPPASVEELRERAARVSRLRVPQGSPEGDDIVDPEGAPDEAYERMVQEEVPALARIAAALFGLPPAEVAAIDAEAAAFTMGGAAEGAAPVSGRHRG